MTELWVVIVRRESWSSSFEVVRGPFPTERDALNYIVRLKLDDETSAVARKVEAEP